MSLGKIFYRVPLADIMDPDPPLVPRDAPLSEVGELVSFNGHVWVVEDRESKRLVGVISEKDLLDIMAPIPDKSHTVGRIELRSLHHTELSKAELIMSKPVVSCGPQATVEEALGVLCRHQIRRLAVVEGGEIVGQVCLRALIRGYARYVT
ncbi:MAG: cyclic nucleotide-binding/CBS domain-containing protein [Chloroflexota bacterium]